jgi:hypothetical protein
MSPDLGANTRGSLDFDADGIVPTKKLCVILTFSLFQRNGGNNVRDIQR